VDRKIKIFGQLKLIFELYRLMFQELKEKKKTRQLKCFCEEDKQQNIKNIFGRRAVNYSRTFDFHEESKCMQFGDLRRGALRVLLALAPQKKVLAVALPQS
jgi:hypothetical protein